MSKSKNTRGKKEEECKVAKVSNFVTDIRGFAKFLQDQNIGFEFEDEFNFQIPSREICRKINEFLDKPKSKVPDMERTAGVPYYLEGNKKSVVNLSWKYLKEPTMQYTLKVAIIEKLGDIKKEDGDELVSVYWLGIEKPTWEPLNDVIETLKEDEKNDLLQDIEKKRVANKPEQPKKSILKKPAESEVDEKPKKHQTFGKRVYEPIPATYARDALPTDAQLSTAGETLKALEKDKNVKASSILANWWTRSVGDELNNLYVVDNPGCGDCMYLAVAPMLRALKPELFQGVVEKPQEDAIRLRQLLAALLPETQQGLTDYFNSYKDNFTSEVSATNYNREYAQKKDEATADYRKRLQEQMMQSEHYAHLPDFGFLGKLIGSSVAIILIGGEYNGPNANTNRVKGRREVEKFVIYPAVVVPAQLDDQNTRYVFVVHRNEHFTRLRKENGQFAFSQEELRREFPTIWGIFERIVKPDDYSRQLVELKDAILARYGELELLARPPGQDRSRKVIINGLLRINDKETPGEKDRERLKTFSKSNYKEERDRIVDELVSETVSNNPAILAKNAKAKVAQFISEYNPNSIATSLEKPVKATPSKKIATPICTPLNNDEEAKLASIKKAAKDADKGFVFQEWGGHEIKKNEIDRLTLYDEVGRQDEEKYINDEIVNSYAEKTLDETRSNPLLYYKAGFLTTAFYKLQKKKDEKELARFNTIGPLQDIFALEKLFIPVNVDDIHWILAVVNFTDKKIEFYDSLCSVNTAEPVFEAIKRYLRVKANALERENIQWVKVVYQKDDLPQQDNYIDCGVFVIAYIRDLVRRDFEKFKFSQEDIICLRKRIMLELLPDFDATNHQVGKQPLDLQISPSQSPLQPSQQKEEDKVVVQTSKRRRQTSPPVSQDSPPRVETIEQVISDDEAPIPESEWGKYID